MSQFLPFGKQIIPTQQQIEKEKYKFEQYEFYGIPYGEFDDTDMGEEYINEKEEDWDEARLFIMRGEPLPKDLAARLLKYKEQLSRSMANKN